MLHGHPQKRPTKHAARERALHDTTHAVLRQCLGPGYSRTDFVLSRLGESIGYFQGSLTQLVSGVPSGTLLVAPVYTRGHRLDPFVVARVALFGSHGTRASKGLSERARSAQADVLLLVTDARLTSEEIEMLEGSASFYGLGRLVVRNLSTVQDAIVSRTAL